MSTERDEHGVGEQDRPQQQTTHGGMTYGTATYGAPAGADDASSDGQSVQRDSGEGE
jgi:hypothetical protein